MKQKQKNEQKGKQKRTKNETKKETNKDEVDLKEWKRKKTLKHKIYLKETANL